MEKDAVITLKSVQSDGFDKHETELITSGSYSVGDGRFVISYDESEATGFVGSRTSLTCTEDGIISMDRTGSAESHLTIEKEKKHYCHYGTPFGEFMIGIYTNTVDNKLSEDGGSLYVKYTIDINSSYLSDNEMYITVRTES